MAYLLLETWGFNFLSISLHNCFILRGMQKTFAETFVGRGFNIKRTN